MTFKPHGKHLIAGEWIATDDTFTSEPASGEALLARKRREAAGELSALSPGLERLPVALAPVRELLGALLAPRPEARPSAAEARAELARRVQARAVQGPLGPIERQRLLT